MLLLYARARRGAQVRRFLDDLHGNGGVVSTTNA
jgi:hypothetical protein